GRWVDRVILDENALVAATTPNAVTGIYGQLWWIVKRVREHAGIEDLATLEGRVYYGEALAAIEQRVPTGATDVLSQVGCRAEGIEGQQLVVFPERRL